MSFKEFVHLIKLLNLLAQRCSQHSLVILWCGSIPFPPLWDSVLPLAPCILSSPFPPPSHALSGFLPHARKACTCLEMHSTQSYGSPHFSLTFADHWFSFLDTQCFENCYCIYIFWSVFFFFFLVASGRKINLVLFTPSWSEAEVQKSYSVFKALKK